jgi:hypothetical protein
MASLSPPTSPVELAETLRHLARAARAQADAIALNPDARAAGHIEVTAREDETLLLVPSAASWRKGDSVMVSSGGTLIRAHVSSIHRPLRAAVLRAEASVHSGAGEIFTEYDALPRRVAELLEDFATRADCPVAVPFDRAVPGAASLLGLAPPRIRTPFVPAAIRLAVEQYLTPEQMLAWAHALRQDALLLAPPGTGKTRVLAAVAVALAAMGYPVALAAPSRTARDLLFTAYREALADIPLAGHHREAARAVAPTALTLPQAYMRDCAYPDDASLVIDEVSIATLPALIAAGRDASHVVAGGDLWQLGPVVEGPAFARAGQCVPPFGVDLSTGRLSPALVRLRHSRRLPAAVADVMRALAYGPDGPLGHHAPDAPLDGTPFGAPLTIVDTSGVGSAESSACVYDALRRATAPVLHGGARLRPLVVTPTRARGEALTTMLRGYARVSTVHGAQGQEAPVAVVDLLVDLLVDLQRLDWFRAAGALEEGGRLLTVAITRASRHAIVVVDVARLRRHAGPLWARLLEVTATTPGVATVRVADLLDGPRG